MQEVRDLTTVMSDAIAFIRKAHADAKDSLMAEVTKARANVDKVASLTKDFKQANMELEAFIGGTASNFPPADSEIAKTDNPKADANGVILHKE